MVAINALFGTALAWVLVRDEFRGKKTVDAIIDLPFALPTIVSGLVLLTLYGPSSPIGVDVAYSRIAIGMALLFVTLPFVVRSVQPVLIELDREAEEAATSLGASSLTTFRRVILPPLVPAILGGAGLAMARALGEFGSIVLLAGNIPFDTEVASLRVFGLIEQDDPAGAAAVSIVLLAMALARPDRVHAPAEEGAAPCGVGSRCGRSSSPTWRRCWCCRSASSSTARSRTASSRRSTRVTDPDTLHALYLTVLIAVIAVPINTVFGVAAAFVLVRQKFRGQGVINALIDLPFAMSPVVIGLALLLLFGRQGWFGDYFTARDVQIIYALPGMIFATVMVSLPFVVREVAPVLREMGDEQEQAARTLGARPHQVFRRVTLPGLKPGIAYGVVLATARALGEFGAVSVVSGKIVGQTETLPLRVEERFQSFDMTGAYAAAVILALLAIATVLATRLIQGREVTR